MGERETPCNTRIILNKNIIQNIEEHIHDPVKPQHIVIINPNGY